MEKFLMIVFWIIFSFYLLRLIFRYAFPWLLARFIRKMAGNMQQQAYRQQGTSPRDEGKVFVNTEDVNQQKIDPEIGEYVDFEDIKEPKKP